MLNGVIAFAQPWVLAALMVLPMVWWLLRLVPPPPKLQRFPPVRLLFALAKREETPDRTPPWLIVLRLVLVALIIVALAGPIFNPGAALGGKGPLLLVVDDGWTAAARWQDRLDAMDDYIDRAERAGRPVVLLTTAPPAGGTSRGADQPPLQAISAAQARKAVRSLRPKPWPVDRTAALDKLNKLVLPDTRQAESMHAAWLSDGIDDGGAVALIKRLRRFPGFELIRERDDNLPRALLPLDHGAADPVVAVARAPTPRQASIWLRASTADGRVIARRQAGFEAGAERASVQFALPLALRNQITRIEIENERSAGSVLLTDDRWRRQPVGLVSGQAIEAAQPLLSNLYYLRKALEPLAELRDGAIGDLLDSKVTVLVLADVGGMTGPEHDDLDQWTRAGGTLIRFAGPKLADNARAPFLPVALRGGGRAMGGAMSWEQPARIAPFEDSSPFAGLELPGDVVVERQVLAEPAPEVSARTWARLEDGTPLVTGARHGDGWIVLFHVTSNTDWSNLPISGLFVAMLERVVALARTSDTTPKAEVSLPPFLVMDGFGSLGSPDPDTIPLKLERASTPSASAVHPPGYYGREASPMALNLMAEAGPIGPDFVIRPMTPVSGITDSLYGQRAEFELGPWVLLVALLLAMVDFAVALILRGLALPRQQALVAGLIVLGAAALTPEVGWAQASTDKAPLQAALEVRLGYVNSGDPHIDAISRTGLLRLGEVLTRRTTVTPGPPAGLDPATDELILFPLIYWPLTGKEQPLSAEGQANFAKYLKTGGILVVDTRDMAAGTQALRKALGKLDIAPLIRLPEDHVLARSFYLLHQFSGFQGEKDIWVERHSGGVNDGVSALIIVGGNLAADWALGEFARSHPERGEAAFRFGVNLVMYALTGNYKADQVHVPALLERLGR
ncbi:MAG: DUF4159 domain-containing protein [Sphingomonadales bacterium]